MIENDRFNRRRRRRARYPTSVSQSTNGESRNEQPNLSSNGRQNNGTTNHNSNNSNNSNNNNKHEIDSGNDENDHGHPRNSSHRLSNVFRKRKDPCHKSWIWCLETKNKALDKISKLSRKQVRLLVVAKMILFCVKLLFLHWLFSKSYSYSKQFVGRSLTDESLNEIPLIIPAFDYTDETDIGGWKHPRRFFWPREMPKDTVQNQSLPDFGGLNIYRSIDDTISKKQIPAASKLAPKRQIHPNDAWLAFSHWYNETDKGYVYIHGYEQWPEDVEDEKHTCQYPNWVKEYHPLCNDLHEMSLLDRSDKHYVSHGSFRDVWLVDHPSIPFDSKQTLKQSALKMSRWYMDYVHGTYMAILNDAMVMERLAFSPRIVDIYGHCGTSVWVEPMPYDVQDSVIKGDGLSKQKDLHDEKELQPQNDYTIEEKLDLALGMAESLADLHGFRDGVIVHDDVQVAQWLKTPDQRLKFGDFNRAMILKYDSKGEEYCQYSTGGRGWRFRSPEEYARKYADDNHPDLGWMDEKIDVYSYGNGIYGLLTGLWPFYEIDDDSVPRGMVYNGTRPFLDPRWKEQGYIASKLVEVMEQCWTHNATERISIFNVVKQLREVKKEHHHQQQQRRIMTNRVNATGIETPK